MMLESGGKRGYTQSKWHCPPIAPSSTLTRSVRHQRGFLSLFLVFAILKSVAKLAIGKGVFQYGPWREFN